MTQDTSRRISHEEEHQDRRSIFYRVSAGRLAGRLCSTGDDVMNESHFSDGWSFLIAVALLVFFAIGGTQIVDWMKKPVVSQCSITFSDAAGNRHTFIGQGEVKS